MSIRDFRGVLAMMCIIAFVTLSACTPEQTADENGEQMEAIEQTAATPSLELSWTVSGLMQPESACYDAERNVIYVSNINGQPTEANGAGFISKISPSGELQELKWVEGFNAPKGINLYGSTLYVSDLNRIVAVDVDSGEWISEYSVEDAQFLNDVEIAEDGTVYVSDMFADRIYMLRDGEVSVLVESTDLEFPNGLFIRGDALYVGAWGVVTDPATFGTETPGRLLSVSLGNMPAVGVVGEGAPVGNLDGLEGLDNGDFFASDWVSGAIYYLSSAGEATTLLTTSQGSADIGIISSAKLLLVPMMMEGELRAYTYSF